MSIRSTEIHKNRDFGNFHRLGKKIENTSPEIHCTLHIQVLAAQLHSPQTTAHPFQLPQGLLLNCMSANVLLSFEQLLFPQVCTGSLTLHDCNIAMCFSEKAASYRKTQTHWALSWSLCQFWLLSLKCYQNAPAALCKRSCELIISRSILKSS